VVQEQSIREDIKYNFLVISERKSIGLGQWSATQATTGLPAIISGPHPQPELVF